jgi:hypothetical protein
LSVVVEVVVLELRGVAVLVDSVQLQAYLLPQVQHTQLLWVLVVLQGLVQIILGLVEAQVFLVQLHLLVAAEVVEQYLLV